MPDLDYLRRYYSGGFTSPYGDCRPANGSNCGRRHRGQDLSHSTRSGTIAVPSLFAGRVVGFTKPNDGSGFGHGIKIQSKLGDGSEWIFHYSHGPWASSQKLGEWVEQGQIILHEGMSGFTSGPCVHIEQQKVGGGFTDPRPEINRVARGQGNYGQTVAPAPAPAPANAGGGGDGWVNGVHGPNPFGIPFTGGLQKVAKLNGYGTRWGNGALDQDWGGSTPKAAAKSGSMKGFAQFLRDRWGYKGNDELGAVMWAAIARWLRATEGYTGNDVPGPVMRAALSRRDTANWQQLA